MSKAKPHFTIKNKFQKRSEKYRDILKKSILKDVCKRITGREDYTVEFDNTVYNKGRLATLEYRGTISYISFSEFEIESRNSFFQSFPSALVKYHQETNHNKQIYFYFLEPDGNIETPYFIFMYRLMKTAGTIFLNESDYLTNAIAPFSSPSDIIVQRDKNKGKNKGNTSSYVTVDENNILQVFGKTYGANKYETTLICIAIHRISKLKMELYEIQEGNLKKLPEEARAVIVSLGIKVITSDKRLEREEFEKNDSLRSPTYLYNLLEKLGDKKCSLCDCEIPQIIQGAHVWAVASIKKVSSLNQDKKLEFATDGDNGLWLCNNHHKLFDMNILLITKEGKVKYKTNLRKIDSEFINDVTYNSQIPKEILTPTFLQHLEKRNISLNQRRYSFVE
jgi:hypothetical protein